MSQVKILCLVFLVQAVVAGSTQYAYTALVVEVAQAFDAEIYQAMFALTTMSIVVGLLSAVAGGSLQRYLRHLMLLGGVSLTTGFVLLGISDSLPRVILIYGTLIALGCTLTAPLATSTLIANWFVDLRGRALSIAAIGTSFGGILYPPAIAFLLDDIGWRATYLYALGGSCLLMTVMMVLALRENPSDLGGAQTARPVGEIASETDSRDRSASTSKILHQPRFWVISAAVGLTFSVYMGILTNFIPHGLQLGLSAREGAALLSIVAMAGVLAKLTIGLYADFLGARNMLLLAISAMVVCSLTLFIGKKFSTSLLAAITLGTATVGLMPIWPALIGENFKAGDFSKVMGLMSPVVMAAMVTGPPLASYLFALTGSYQVSFLVFLIVLVTTAGLTLFLPRYGSKSVERSV